MAYRVYTKEFDEIIRPLDIVDQEVLDRRALVFHDLCPVKDFEPLRERLETLKAPELTTGVCILIDNSGSMRGAPIAHAVGTVGIISMYLDRLGVPNEVLGFTTARWKGGHSREHWIANGRPSKPGRLNDLRHIIYKQTDEKMQDVRSNLALMMPGEEFSVLKENIDGEAVEWACERLRTMDVEKRVLLVISDGAPVDDSTGQINDSPFDKTKSPTAYRGRSYLYKHLRKVIRALKKAGDIHLDAIGMQHNVSDFYGVGDQINVLGDLAPTAIAKLEAMLR